MRRGAITKWLHSNRGGEIMNLQRKHSNNMNSVQAYGCKCKCKCVCWFSWTKSGNNMGSYANAEERAARA